MAVDHDPVVAAALEHDRDPTGVRHRLALRVFGLEPKVGRNVGHIASGMNSKVRIARAHRARTRVREHVLVQGLHVVESVELTTLEKQQHVLVVRVEVSNEAHVALHPGAVERIESRFDFFFGLRVISIGSGHDTSEQKQTGQDHNALHVLGSLGALCIV